MKNCRYCGVQHLVSDGDGGICDRCADLERTLFFSSPWTRNMILEKLKLFKGAPKTEKSRKTRYVRGLGER